MNLLPNAKGYATQENAIKKLQDALGDSMAETRWVITVNTEGRYVPTLVGDDYITTALYNGLAVIS